MQSESYTIRVARFEDLAHLPAIERAAAALFRTTAYPAMADADLAAPHIDLARDQVWVAVDEQDHPVAFAVAHALDHSFHLHELDVDPRYARRGLGRALIATIAAWARAEGYTALTLSTFRAIPWNGPYYTRLGFQPLDESQLSPDLQAVRQAEAAAGLPIGERMCMRLAL